MLSWKLVKDINYSYFNFSNMAQLIEINYFGRSGLLRQLGLFVYRLLSKIFIDVIRFNRLIFSYKGKVVFLSVAQNNWEAMEGISTYIESSVEVSTIYTNRSSYLVPFSISYIIGIFYIPSLLFWYFKASKNERKILEICGSIVLLSCGYYLWSKLIMTYWRPKTIVVSNDHVFETRVLIHLSNKMDIPCYYFQHAPVNEEMPPLMFSASFLDGNYSLDCYKNSSNCMTYLVGNLKYEKYRKSTKSVSSISTIGIATNGYFDGDEVSKLITKLHTDLPDIKIITRPHPEEDYSSYADFVQHSDWEKERTFEFLKNVDILISSNSGIILEAGLLNILTISYDRLLFEKARIIDAYNMKKNSVYKTMNNMEDLIRFIREHKNNRPGVPKIIEYYFSNVQSPISSNPQKYVAEIILSNL